MQAEEQTTNVPKANKNALNQSPTKI